MGRPNVYPTGVTRYDPEKASSGYTLFPSHLGATLVDMNGRIVKIWRGLNNSPVKPMPGGQVMGSLNVLPGRPGANSCIDTVQVDWDGNVVWRFNQNEEVTLPDGQKIWASRQHHDFQREGSPTGYYAPGSTPLTGRGSTILLTHHNCMAPAISDQELIDERIIEITWDGKIIWEWNACDHIDEMGFDDAARAAMFKNPHHGDWIHFNAVNKLGENDRFDQGDSRFAPENLICSSFHGNLLLIIEKSSSKIVWRVGPDYTASPELAALGPIIGQHFVHMIPRSLPGAGNILLFDNGFANGFGAPHVNSPDGTSVLQRPYSRVLEFDPVTLEISWEYSGVVKMPNGSSLPLWAHAFYSPFISSAMRLPNGNTLITQGADGIITEVTPEKEIVWEFINPLPNVTGAPRNSIYRAYRVPYEWVPQLSRPEEIAVKPPENEVFQVPGSLPPGNPEDFLVEIEL